MNRPYMHLLICKHTSVQWPPIKATPPEQREDGAQCPAGRQHWAKTVLIISQCWFCFSAAVPLPTSRGKTPKELRKEQIKARRFHWILMFRSYFVSFGQIDIKLMTREQQRLRMQHFSQIYMWMVEQNFIPKQINMNNYLQWVTVMLSVC